MGALELLEREPIRERQKEEIRLAKQGHREQEHIPFRLPLRQKLYPWLRTRSTILPELPR